MTVLFPAWGEGSSDACPGGRRQSHEGRWDRAAAAVGAAQAPGRIAGQRDPRVSVRGGRAGTRRFQLFNKYSSHGVLTGQAPLWVC